jgi:hypothetical protein
MSFEARTADSLRSNDWGGFRNSITAENSWAYWLLRLVADKLAKLPIKPDLERPRRLPGETAEDFLARRNHWLDRYGEEPKVVQAADESNEDFRKRQKREIAAWKLVREQNYVEDVQKYRRAVMARVAIMGFPWWDRRPEDTIPHDGALRVLSAIRWADWLAMVGLVRGLNSTNGDGLVPEYDGYLKDWSVKSRNYRNETIWFESDEGALLDPASIWKNMGAILRPHVINIINYRTFGTYGNDFLKVQLDMADVKRESATMIRDQLYQMWTKAPEKGIKSRLLKIFYDAVDENVIHVRPIITKFLAGLPTDLVERLQPFIRGLNRRSDRRVNLWAVHLSVGLTHGKRSFTMAGKFIDEMYGTNLYPNEPPSKAQERQDNLGFLTWMNMQYDKAVPFVRGFIMREHNKIFVNAKELLENVIKAVEGGMYPDLAWELLDIVSKRGLILTAKDWTMSLDDFKKQVAKTGIEEKFEKRVREILGSGEFESVVTGRLFPAMQNATDPYKTPAVVA